MEVTEAIRNRKSARAFLDKAVPDEVVTEILECARWAPSGANTQPWHVAVLTGETKRQLGDAMAKRRTSGEKSRPDYNYYPTKSEEPYISRKYACAHALYSALGIERKDIEKRKMQWIKNYHHFGAPVALLFFIDTIPRERLVGGHRDVHPKRHARRPRPWTRDLPASRPRRVSRCRPKHLLNIPNSQKTYLRRGAWLCGLRRSVISIPHRPRAGRELSPNGIR